MLPRTVHGRASGQPSRAIYRIQEAGRRSLPEAPALAQPQLGRDGAMRVWMLSGLRVGVSAIGLCLAVMAGAGPAWGAPLACGPRDDVLAQLSKKFKEAPVSIGLANNGGLLEVLASPDGSTWTVIITRPNGVTCLVAAGESWQAIRPAETGTPL